MAHTLTLYRKNTATLEIRGVHQESDGAYLDAATVRLEDLQKPDGSSVTGQSFPTSMASEGGGTGNYSVVLENDLGVVDGDRLTAIVSIDDGVNRNGWLELPIFVIDREKADP